MNQQEFPIRLKERFPFRIATTSFIYPASWAANSRRLAPYVDEIELLFFSSRSPEDSPSRNEIRELAAIPSVHPLRYNVHLPTDIHPGASDIAARRSAADTILRYMDLTAGLNPTTWTLHLPVEPDLPRSRWRRNLHHTISEILAAGYPSRSLSIETLEYPLHWIEEVISDFDLSVCIDLGHLIRYGQPLAETVNHWCKRITIFHLHGVSGNRDHVSLNQLPASVSGWLREILPSFRETVSLEVFSYSDFQASAATLLDLLSSRYPDYPGKVEELP